MKRNIVLKLPSSLVPLLLLFLLAAGCSDSKEKAAEKMKEINVCQLVSDEQISRIYKKPLIKKGEGRQCLWSKDPGGMAYFDIGVHEQFQDLRKYFTPNLPSHATLEAISDLGDEGLMIVSEGSLGVIVIRKGGLVLQSAGTFLDIEPGSDQQKALWDIYRTVLQAL